MNMNNAPMSAIAALCLAYDAIYEANNDRRGGPLNTVFPLLDGMERHILSDPTDDPTVIMWKATLLARGIACDWKDEAVEEVAASLGRDLVIIAPSGR